MMELEITTLEDAKLGRRAFIDEDTRERRYEYPLLKEPSYPKWYERFITWYLLIALFGLAEYGIVKILIVLGEW